VAGCAVAHGDADVGVLEGQRVVDAVTGHGDDVGTLLEGVDEGPLLVRSDTPEDRRDVDRGRQLGGVVRQGASVHRGPDVGDADALGHGPDGPRVVARDDLEADALRLEVPHRLRGVRSDLLLEREDGDGRQTRGQRLALERGVGVGDQEHPLARVRERVHPGSDRGVGRAGAEDDLRALRPSSHGRRRWRRSTCGPTRTAPTRSAPRPPTA
jgi:hypothetical protein